MTSENLRIGECIAIELPEVGQVIGTVRWNEDVQFGLEFAQSLSRAELAATRLLCQHRKLRKTDQAISDYQETPPIDGIKWRDRLPSLKLLLAFGAFWAATVVALI